MKQTIKENDLLNDEGKILEAIKAQRWFFIKNKPNILFDKVTGYLWPNLKQFKRQPKTFVECKTILKNMELDGYKGWKLPSKNDVIVMTGDKGFPFHEGGEYRIAKSPSVYIENPNNSNQYAIWLDDKYPKEISYNQSISGHQMATFSKRFGSSYKSEVASFFLPVNKGLSSEKNKNKYSSDRERVQFTLDLFIENGFLPIFNNPKMTNLYKQLYIDKNRKSQQAQEELEKPEGKVLKSSTFDYKQLLEGYHLEEINSSIFKYYQSVQLWNDGLLNWMGKFEKANKEVISDFNMINLAASNDYEPKSYFSDEENNLFKQRKSFLKSHFEVGIRDIKQYMTTIKKEAKEVEERIDRLYFGKNTLQELAVIEDQKRPSFLLMAEFTANLVTKGLEKVNHFHDKRDFVMKVVSLETMWILDYEILVNDSKNQLKIDCEKDSIEETTWQEWFENWRTIRFTIEKYFLPLLEAGFSGKLDPEVIVELLEALKNFKVSIDHFFLKERADIHKRIYIQVGVDLQEKLEVESELYKLTSVFQEKVQEIVFGIKETKKKLFVLKQIEGLMDIQIEEMISFLKRRDLSVISQDVLSRFSALRKKNYDLYIDDLKAYNQERIKREKEYNSLLFKMKKDLMKTGSKK